MVEMRGIEPPEQVIKIPLNTDFFYIRVAFRVGLSIQTYECVSACDTAATQSLSQNYKLFAFFRHTIKFIFINFLIFLKSENTALWCYSCKGAFS